LSEGQLRLLFELQARGGTADSAELRGPDVIALMAAGLADTSEGRVVLSKQGWSTRRDSEPGELEQAFPEF